MEFLSNILQPLVDLMRTVVEMFYQLTASAGFKSYGVAIILLTVVIKMILYPLTVKQIKSMKAMQELQPKMKALQERYRGNPQLLNQEMAKLYQTEGINPLAGCLPLLAQMPIMMAMYYALNNFPYHGEPSFLWMPSLSLPDPVHILPVLSAATTYYQQKQTSADMGAGGGAQMKIMMYTMPLFIGWMSWTFDSGLVLYWVTMNFMQIGQQWFMFRGNDADKKSEKKEKVVDAEFKEKKPAKKNKKKK